MKLNVEISDDVQNGLRGAGGIASDGRMEVRFWHNADRLRRGEVQANGDVVWDGSSKVWTYADEQEQRWSVPRADRQHDAAAAPGAAEGEEGKDEVTAQEEEG